MSTLRGMQTTQRGRPTLVSQATLLAAEGPIFSSPGSPLQPFVSCSVRDEATDRTIHRRETSEDVSLGSDAQPWSESEEKEAHASIPHISQREPPSVVSLRRFGVRLLMSCASFSPADFASAISYSGPAEATLYYPTGNIRRDRILCLYYGNGLPRRPGDLQSRKQ